MCSNIITYCKQFGYNKVVCARSRSHFSRTGEARFTYIFSFGLFNPLSSFLKTINVFVSNRQQTHKVMSSNTREMWFSEELGHHFCLELLGEIFSSWFEQASKVSSLIPGAKDCTESVSYPFLYQFHKLRYYSKVFVLFSSCLLISPTFSHSCNYNVIGSMK